MKPKTFDQQLASIHGEAYPAWINAEGRKGPGFAFRTNRENAFKAGLRAGLEANKPVETPTPDRAISLTLEERGLLVLVLNMELRRSPNVMTAAGEKLHADMKALRDKIARADLAGRVSQWHKETPSDLVLVLRNGQAWDAEDLGVIIADAVGNATDQDGIWWPTVGKMVIEAMA